MDKFVSDEKHPKTCLEKHTYFSLKKTQSTLFIHFQLLLIYFCQHFLLRVLGIFLEFSKHFRFVYQHKKHRLNFFFLGNLILVTVLNNAEKRPELFKKRFFWFVILGNITQKPFINRPTLPLSILLHCRLHRDLNYTLYSDRHFLFTFHQA